MGRLFHASTYEEVKHELPRVEELAADTLGDSVGALYTFLKNRPFAWFIIDFGALYFSSNA